MGFRISQHYFWAGMMSSQRCESMHAFFDGYITGRSPLKQFVEQYEVALRFTYEKEIEIQTSKRKQLVRPTTMFDWDIQTYGHYTRTIYNLFKVHVARLPHCEIERHVDFDAVEGVEKLQHRFECLIRRRDLKNVLKAHFKAYLEWDDVMDVPNVPNLDSNSDAIFINLREICSHGRPQINRRSSRQNTFWGSRYYDVYDEDQSSQGRSGGGRRGRRESRGGGVWGGRGDDANVSNHPTVYQFL
ncbi:hypothetical protein CQW23_02351 [Capsicum baccatum]|uniref:Protein FAR1-RELATED SEQUENCE n=1 Tax=Capsicum baccatum TaxID=33114 RepID=A0A2G2XR85_CAPBA|nr:hypothetical protein CQW23_02351 [Capsicum baccatum]